MSGWRKSTYSQGMENSSCVEVADLVERVGVRDSKAPDAGHLRLTDRDFGLLVRRVKDLQ
ncbi:DUF397 domain-containing protein [Actinomadura harenae]|uniref:DUF397 domain-containing protein n=1 Tax=Actinomadura harenae TaxID=2483351 RepID=A0A3M2LSQ2_9ACTN|nr:DUF397 domain-containing protein [Actinomadura harenae]RMI40504.1 DUF397 domain-containing protein [Actinomadura harenae]